MISLVKQDSAFPKSLLAGLDPLVVLHMPYDDTQDDLLHNLPWQQGQAKRTIISQDPPSGPPCNWASCLPASSQLELPQLAKNAYK